jgi:hypothetical protein
MGAATSGRMRSLLALSSLLGALSVGCGSEPASLEQSQLDSALQTWDSQHPAQYSFTWRQSCECTSETTQPIQITVSGNAIVSAVYVETQQPVSAGVRSGLMTIEGVFDEIQQAIVDGAYAVTVTYDPSSGAPLTVGVDYDELVADEELALVISDIHTDLAHMQSDCGALPPE